MKDETDYKVVGSYGLMNKSYEADCEESEPKCRSTRGDGRAQADAS